MHAKTKCSHARNRSRRVLSWNIGRGFLKKLKEIESVITDQKIDIAFISECDNPQQVESIEIPGYKTIAGPVSKINNKVRIIAFVNESLDTKVRTDLMNDGISSIWIEIVRKNQKNILCCGVYREWSQNPSMDLRTLCDQVDNATSEKKPTLIQGDFNLNSDLWDQHNYEHKSLADMWRSNFAQNGLSQTDMGITFVSYYTLSNGEKVESALDHVYSNDDKVFKNNKDQKLPNRMSDHQAIFSEIQMMPGKEEKKKPSYILRRCWKNFNQSDFKKDLANQPWEAVINPSKNVNEQAETFDELLKNTLDEHAPLRKTKIRENYRSGLSEKTKELIRERDTKRLEKNKCVDTRKDVLEQKYRQCRNAVTSQIRRESKQATLQSIAESGNPSEYWRAAKRVTSCGSKPKLNLMEGGTLIENEEELSEIFNKYFKEKIEKIESEIPEVEEKAKDRLEEKMESRKLRFSLRQVTIEQVKKAIRSMKNKTSSGIDFISPKIVKSVSDEIANPLTYIINNSISEGEFPDSWKIAKVIPIFKKKGLPSDKVNYRPVSNLKSVSKVIEILVNKQVLNFFEANNLLPESQHGFRGKRSTFSAVATMHELWIKNLERKENQSLTFLDLSAAFDTLSRDIFCSKLKAYGFDLTSRNWFRSYLTDRSQCVMIGSHMSGKVTLKVGSPQGAILSPTIFIILISDIELWTDAAICGYADDTSCTNSDECMEKLREKCEKSVNSLLKYMAANKLSANDDKTHILVVRKDKNHPEQLSFQAGNSTIKEKSSEKLLGMTVSNDLKWTDHLSKLEGYLRQRLFTLRRIEQQIPRSLLKRVADGIFMSKLRYGIAIMWPVRIKESDPEPSAIKGVKVVFNDMLRLLNGVARKDKVSIASMLSKLGWLSINQLVAEVRLVEVWKALNTKNTLSNLFEKVEGTTRASQNNKIKVVKNSQLRENSFVYPTVKLWNSAPVSVTRAETENKAKKGIREFVKSLPL